MYSHENHHNFQKPGVFEELYSSPFNPPALHHPPSYPHSSYNSAGRPGRPMDQELITELGSAGPPPWRYSGDTATSMRNSYVQPAFPSIKVLDQPGYESSGVATSALSPQTSTYRGGTITSALSETSTNQIQSQAVLNAMKALQDRNHILQSENSRLKTEIESIKHYKHESVLNDLEDYTRKELDLKLKLQGMEQELERLKERNTALLLEREHQEHELKVSIKTREERELELFSEVKRLKMENIRLIEEVGGWRGKAEVGDGSEWKSLVRDKEREIEKLEGEYGLLRDRIRANEGEITRIQMEKESIINALQEEVRDLKSYITSKHIPFSAHSNVGSQLDAPLSSAIIHASGELAQKYDKLLSEHDAVREELARVKNQPKQYSGLLGSEYQTLEKRYKHARELSAQKYKSITPDISRIKTPDPHTNTYEEETTYLQTKPKSEKRKITETQSSPRINHQTNTRISTKPQEIIPQNSSSIGEEVLAKILEFKTDLDSMKENVREMHENQRNVEEEKRESNNVIRNVLDVNEKLISSIKKRKKELRDSGNIQNVNSVAPGHIRSRIHSRNMGYNNTNTNYPTHTEQAISTTEPQSYTESTMDDRHPAPTSTEYIQDFPAQYLTKSYSAQNVHDGNQTLSPGRNINNINAKSHMYNNHKDQGEMKEASRQYRHFYDKYLRKYGGGGGDDLNMEIRTKSQLKGDLELGRSVKKLDRPPVHTYIPKGDNQRFPDHPGRKSALSRYSQAAHQTRKGGNIPEKGEGVVLSLDVPQVYPKSRDYSPEGNSSNYQLKKYKLMETDKLSARARELREATLASLTSDTSPLHPKPYSGELSVTAIDRPLTQENTFYGSRDESPSPLREQLVSHNREREKKYPVYSRKDYELQSRINRLKHKYVPKHNVD